MKFPYIIHVNVLLLDGEIVNWKVGTTHWDTVNSAFNNRQLMTVIKAAMDGAEMDVDSMSFRCNNVEENQIIFSEKATEFYKMWEIHPLLEDGGGFLPY